MRPGSLNAATPVETLVWVSLLPTMRLTARQFKDLPEYSGSNPTGVTIGKRWRCLIGAHDLDWKRKGGKPRWVIREYVTVADPKMAGIKNYRPIVIVRSGDTSPRDE